MSGSLDGDEAPYSSSLEGQVLPSCPNGLFSFGEDCLQVLDADEEILELYMDLAKVSDSTGSNRDSGGLGFYNAARPELELSLTLTSDDAQHLGKDIDIEVMLHQDLKMLKTSRGDTGSVLWRSSLYLARHLLRQNHFPPQQPALPLLDPSRLVEARILELGSGTGLLAILLSTQCAEYTASDRYENLKLIKRNLELNGISLDQSPEDSGQAEGPRAQSKLSRSPKSPKISPRTATKTLNDVHKRTHPKPSGRHAVEHQPRVPPKISIEEIDWVSVSEARERRDGRVQNVKDDGSKPAYDLVLAVDCIFNENLVQPLIDTLSEYCPCGGKTVVWVVVELRSPDVLTLFLEKWLGDSSGPWTIIRLGSDAMGSWDGQRPRWVGWVGWR